MSAKLKNKSINSESEQELPVGEPEAVAPVVEEPFSFGFEKKLVTFEQFVQLQGIKPHHVPGVRAFVGDVAPRSKEEWEKLLESY